MSRCSDTFLSSSVHLTPWPPHDLQGKFAEAESLYKRATFTWDKSYGPSHPTLESLLKSRAALAEKQVRGEAPNIDVNRRSISLYGGRLPAHRPSHRRSRCMEMGPVC